MAALLPTRSAAQGSHAGGSHATQVEDPGGQSGVRSPQSDCGTGVRPDQAGARIPAVSVAWYRQGAGGMVTRVPHAQHSENLPALPSVKPAKPRRKTTKNQPRESI